MDIATLLGIISGIGLILGSIVMNSGLNIFISISSLMIVFGGTIAATLISYPLSEFLSVMGFLVKVFTNDSKSVDETIDELVMVADTAKKEGILALEEYTEVFEDDFLIQAIRMLVDGKSKDAIVSHLQTDTRLMMKKHKIGWQIFSKMGEYSPAFGMIGTLIGLIQMLADLNNPSSIGPKMAVALITTFYGTLFANLIYLPMSHKLKRRSAKKQHHRELVLEGIMGIREGTNPRLLREKLLMYSEDKIKSEEEESENEEENSNEEE